MKHNYCFIGFTSTGKSTVGKKIADRLHYSFVDTDQMLEELYQKLHQQTRSCREIYREHGKDFFIDLEHQAIRALMHTHPHHTVIATGGGAVLHQDSATLLGDSCIIIYLKASAESIIERMHKKGLPSYLSGNNPIRELEMHMATRTPIYERLADITINTDNHSLFDVVIQLEQLLTKR